MAATDKNALVETVQALEKRGVPVVTIDSGIEPDISRSFVATDNVAAAKQAATSADDAHRALAMSGFQRSSGLYASKNAAAGAASHGADSARKNKSGSTPILLAGLNTGRGGTGSPEAKAQQQEILRVLKTPAQPR